jgi:chitinase
VGPPHNVIYWQGTNSILPSLTSCVAVQYGGTGCYTDVILSSVYPDQNCNLVYGFVDNIIGPTLADDVSQLHYYGKRVLISFGGQIDSNLTPYNYSVCNNTIPTLVDQLAAFVWVYNLDGIDIDFEDDSAFTAGQQQYDGVSFLNALTDALYNKLNFGHNTITHAPVSKYWLNNSQCQEYLGYSCNWTYNSAPYANVYWQEGPSAYNHIAWFNTQFYNDGSGASEKLSEYQTILNSVGIPPIMLVLGLPVSPGAAPSGGWLDWNDAGGLVVDLQNAYHDQFGGVMGWSAEHDANDNRYTWSNEIWLFLKGNQVPWYAWNFGNNAVNAGCLDGPGTSDGSPVKGDSCNGSTFPAEFWQFSVNIILNTQTGLCLDTDGSTVYTHSCNGGPFQNWWFYGNVNGGATIYNPWTGTCLDAGQAGLIYGCNGGTYQNWSGGSEF